MRFEQKAVVVHKIFLTMVLAVTFGGSTWAADPANKFVAQDDSNKLAFYAPRADTLASYLKSDKPTLAFFYYSVACSCTAARCAIAAAAIDSIPALNGQNDSLNYIKIDAYQESEVEMPYNLTIMPAVVYYDSSGNEINRLEWGTSREAIELLIKNPEIIQIPID